MRVERYLNRRQRPVTKKSSAEGQNCEQPLQIAGVDLELFGPEHQYVGEARRALQRAREICEHLREEWEASQPREWMDEAFPTIVEGITEVLLVDAFYRTAGSPRQSGQGIVEAMNDGSTSD